MEDLLGNFGGGPHELSFKEFSFLALVAIFIGRVEPFGKIW